MKKLLGEFHSVKGKRETIFLTSLNDRNYDRELPKEVNRIFGIFTRTSTRNHKIHSKKKN